MSAHHPISGKGIVFSSSLLLFPAGLCCTEQVACSRAAAHGTQPALELLQSPRGAQGEHCVHQHVWTTSARIIFVVLLVSFQNWACQWAVSLGELCFAPWYLGFEIPDVQQVSWCVFFPLFWRISGTSEHGLCEGKGLICRRRTSEDQDGKHLSESERLWWERTAELCAPWWPTSGNLAKRCTTKPFYANTK